MSTFQNLPDAATDANDKLLVDAEPPNGVTFGIAVALALASPLLLSVKSRAPELPPNFGAVDVAAVPNENDANGLLGLGSVFRSVFLESASAFSSAFSGSSVELTTGVDEKVNPPKTVLGLFALSSSSSF